MGLYGERIGFLSGVVASDSVVSNIMAQMTLIVRPMYSNPAGHGAKILGRILKDESLLELWKRELEEMVSRVDRIRRRLRELLESHCPVNDWSALTKQIGMFYFSDLTPDQGMALMMKHHVYILPSSGRINIGAVTDRNVEYVAKALADVVMEGKEEDEPEF